MSAPKKPMDRLQAESEVTDDPAPRTYEFAGQTFTVLPFFDWDKSALRAVNNADMDGWAAGAMPPKDAALFANTKATIRETMIFVRAIADEQGADMGELFAS